MHDTHTPAFHKSIKEQKKFCFKTHSTCRYQRAEKQSKLDKPRHAWARTILPSCITWMLSRLWAFLKEHVFIPISTSSTKVQIVWMAETFFSGYVNFFLFSERQIKLYFAAANPPTYFSFTGWKRCWGQHSLLSPISLCISQCKGPLGSHNAHTRHTSKRGLAASWQAPVLAASALELPSATGVSALAAALHPPCLDAGVQCVGVSVST